MAYVPVPKDLTKVKTKVILNLTKRQLICFSAALMLGLPLFFLLKDSAGTSAAAFVMILVMLPCFLFAMYEKHGQPLETIVKHIIQTKFIRPKERPYQTENYYTALEKQNRLDREIGQIVNGKSQKSPSESIGGTRRELVPAREFCREQREQGHFRRNDADQKGGGSRC